jgi:hypothetical protein
MGDWAAGTQADGSVECKARYRTEHHSILGGILPAKTKIIAE